MELEECRILDLIVHLERRIDISRFRIERVRAFGRLERIAAGFIEFDAPSAAPRVVFDHHGTQLKPELLHWLRVRWIALQRSLRAQLRDAAE